VFEDEGFTVAMGRIERDLAFVGEIISSKDAWA